MASSLPTAPATITAGTKPTAANLNTFRDNLNFLLNPPKAEVYLSAAQSPGSGTVQVLLDTFAVNTDSFTLSSNGIVIQTPGRYRCVGLVSCVFNATGRRGTQIRKNGGITSAISRAMTVTDASQSTFMQAQDDLLCVAGDILTLYCEQVSGGALALNTGANNTYLHIVWCGES